MRWQGSLKIDGAGAYSGASADDISRKIKSMSSAVGEWSSLLKALSYNRTKLEVFKEEAHSYTSCNILS